MVGVDTGLRGAVVTVRPNGNVMHATLLDPGKRMDGWKTPSPPEVSRVYMQMREHLEDVVVSAIVYEQVSATRGIAAARSLFMCEGLLLDIAHDMGVPIFGAQQATLRAWVKQHLGIQKWQKGKGKQQILEGLDQLDPRVMQHAQEMVVDRQRRCPTKRLPDLADAYLAARWGQENIQTEG